MMSVFLWATIVLAALSAVGKPLMVGTEISAKGAALDVAGNVAWAIWAACLLAKGGCA